MSDEIDGREIRNLVDFVEESMPKIRETWRRRFQEGYQARLGNKARATRGRGGYKGSWLKGWDAADEYLKQERENEL